jgi:hypothetical protein
MFSKEDKLFEKRRDKKIIDPLLFTKKTEKGTSIYCCLICSNVKLLGNVFLTSSSSSSIVCRSRLFKVLI